MARSAAGRLVQAVIPGHTLGFGFGAASCGVAGAGMNGNRTSWSDAHTVAGTTATTTMASCYDNADRLIGTTVAGAPAGASPLLAANLTTAAPGASLVYDGRGNTTTLANQVIGSDSDNIGGQLRHHKMKWFDKVVWRKTARGRDPFVYPSLDARGYFAMNPVRSGKSAWAELVRKAGHGASTKSMKSQLLCHVQIAFWKPHFDLESTRRAENYMNTLANVCNPAGGRWPGWWS